MNHKRRALVTGASRGIGRAIALRLAHDGYHVLVHYVNNEEKARAVLEEITDAGGTAEILRADLCDLEQAKALSEDVGELDVLVLNASMQIRSPWQQITCEQVSQQLNCNFTASLLLLQAAAKSMQERGWGRIIAIGSVQERKPHPDMLVYSASKAALSNVVHSLALQLAGNSVTVNTVAPGVIATDRNTEALSDPVYAQKVKDSIPAGFYGQPEDCAGIVSLLCSEEGRYVTGQTIYVDGGKGIQ